MSNPLLLTAAFVLGVIAVGRAARLLTHDDFPPAVAVRRWWLLHTGKWGGLFECPFCMAPYLAAGNLAWIAVAGVEPDGFWSWSWWLVNLWAAASYLAAIVVLYDEPPED